MALSNVSFRMEDELKEEIPVKKGEIKSILDNNFTGGNIKLRR